MTEVTSGYRVSVTAFWAPSTVHEVEKEEESLPEDVAPQREPEPRGSELPESERLLLTQEERNEREESIVMLLREEKFCYEAANGRKGKAATS